jgi:hypothetical protein
MSAITMFDDTPPLRRPMLVAAFHGWNDAGEAATGAAAVLRQETQATEFAKIESEDFHDFQVARPTVRLTAEGTRRIEWPSYRLSWAGLPGADRDVVFLLGSEPNLRWRTFVDEVAGFADSIGVELAVLLGGLLADVPHTRPVPVTGSSTDPSLGERVVLRRSRYEGPTGITGVLHDACSRAAIPSVSLWAAVPHYLGEAPYLPAVLALAQRVVVLSGADVSLDQLATAAAEQRDDIAGAVGEDQDLVEYIAELERRRASEDAEEVVLPEGDVTGDQLAAEFERYLRERRDDA